MNSLIRWGKFNLVGAAGMIVQLTVLALFTRISPRHYLLCTAAAVEITLLHNFAWHLHFTWRDRKEASALAQCLRFQFSNGAVSFMGNLLIMRFLVQQARLPVLSANAIAITACSLINFGLGDRWVFATET